MLCCSALTEKILDVKKKKTSQSSVHRATWETDDLCLVIQTHMYTLGASRVMLERNQLEQEQGQESIQLSPARVRGH